MQKKKNHHLKRENNTSYYYCFFFFCFLNLFTDFCSMPPEMGDGSSIEMPLYYNPTEDRCFPFKYSGQGGNENRFLLEKDCMRTCSANVDNVYPTIGKRT